jgi:chemotaxis protein CheX
MSRGINVDYINPFIEATIHTFQTMCAVTPVPIASSSKAMARRYMASAASSAWAAKPPGAVVLNFPEQVAVRTVSKFIGEEITSITAGVVDGVGELTNIIAGDAKNRLIQKGYKFEIGLPKIVTGRSYITAQNKSVPCLVVSFASDFGKFCLEVSLKKIG